MKHSTSRCTSCNTIVTLPSMRTRSAQCEACLRKASAALNASRVVEPARWVPAPTFDLDAWRASIEVGDYVQSVSPHFPMVRHLRVIEVYDYSVYCEDPIERRMAFARWNIEPDCAPGGDVKAEAKR